MKMADEKPSQNHQTKIMKLIKSFGYAFRGIQYCFKTQLNFRIHLLAVALVTAAGFIFTISKTEWLVVIICCMSVITTEMINSAIEKLCNMVTTETNSTIKIIKDVAAGAVLLCAMASVAAGAIIFLPKIVELI